MGRPRKAGKRIGKRLSRSKGALLERGTIPPADHIVARREAFARFAARHTPEFAITPEGELRQIDQSQDAIGQLWLVGLLDDHGFDPVDMREKGRTYGELWRKAYPGKTKVASFERADKSTNASTAATKDDRLFRRMDDALVCYDRQCLVDLTDPENGDRIAPWVRALVCEKMRERGVLMEQPIFPSMDDHARLAAAVRALCCVIDGALPQRWERAA